MTKLNQELWGRPFQLVQSYQCESDEDVLNVQIESIANLVDSWEEVEASKKYVESYCLKHDGEQIGSSISNIFKFVIPTELFALRENSTRKVALLCNYRFDPEHGIAVVFKNEKFLEVISQDKL